MPRVGEKSSRAWMPRAWCRRGVPSPLRGADGNVEFLAHARRGGATVLPAVLGDAVERDIMPRCAVTNLARRASSVWCRTATDRSHTTRATHRVWLVEHDVEVRVPATTPAPRAGWYEPTPIGSRPVSTWRSRSAATGPCCTRCSS